MTTYDENRLFDAIEDAYDHREKALNTIITFMRHDRKERLWTGLENHYFDRMNELTHYGD